MQRGSIERSSCGLNASHLAPASRLLGTAAIAFAVAGCSGMIGAPNSGAAGDERDDARMGAHRESNPPNGGPGREGGNGPGAGKPSSQAAPARIRRLTATEIARSLRDAFRLAPMQGASPISDLTVQKGFDNDANLLAVSPDFAESLQAMAEETGAAVRASLPSLLPCADAKPTGMQAESACAQQFVEQYGRLLYRRPLAAKERDELLTLFRTARGIVAFDDSIATVVEAMIQSPYFLFRTEYGTKRGAAVPLTGFELAAELSYALWGSGPDAALLDAAAAGELGPGPGLKKQAERLLGDVRAREGLRRFVVQWFGLRQPDASGLEPSYGRTVASSMLAETLRFLDETIARDGGTFESILTSSRTFVNADLARLYGLSGAPRTAALEPVDLDPARRSGVLTQPAFLASHLSAEFSPVPIGLFVLDNLLCADLPPPPNDVPPAPPLGPNVSTRARFAEHEKSPACFGCHVALDGVGFTFETYDAYGRYQTLERGKFPVDGSGVLTGTDVDGPVAGVPALAKRLAASENARACVATKVLQFMLGRGVNGKPGHGAPYDVSAVASAVAAAKAVNGLSLRRLALELVQSDAFILRNTENLPEGSI